MSGDTSAKVMVTDSAAETGYHGVGADSISVVEGVLLLGRDDVLVAAWAPGHWRSAEKVPQ